MIYYILDTDRYTPCDNKKCGDMCIYQGDMVGLCNKHGKCSFGVDYPLGCEGNFLVLWGWSIMTFSYTVFRFLFSYGI